MNDFTKDELEDIHHSLDGDDTPCRASDEIIEKVQSMIDNYCEHEGYYQFEYGNNSVNYCDKCKTMWKKDE